MASLLTAGPGHHHHHHSAPAHSTWEEAANYANGRDRRGVDPQKNKLRRIKQMIIFWQRVVACLMFIVALAAVAAIIFRSPKALYLRPVTVTFDLGVPRTLMFSSVMWLLVVAVLISAITRAYLGFSSTGKRYAHAIVDAKNTGYSHRMARHVSIYRWILLGAFVTCIVVAMALLAGVTDLFILVGIAIANVTLHWTAYVLELKNHKAPDEKSVTLLPLTFGFLLWAFIQGSILAYFVLGLLSGALGVVGPVGPYYVTIIGVAFVQTCVGLLAFARYTRISRPYTSNKYVERCYLMAEVAYAVFAVVPLFIASFF